MCEREFAIWSDVRFLWGREDCADIVFFVRGIF